MVEIQCPHCDENIELEDGSYGLFDCPFCGDEFEWENHNGDLVDNSDPFSKEALVHQLKIAGIIVPLTVISMAVLMFIYILLLDFTEKQLRLFLFSHSNSFRCSLDVSLRIPP